MNQKTTIIIGLITMASVVSVLFIASTCVTKTEITLKPFWGIATKLPGTEIIDFYEKGTDVKVEATWGGAGVLLSQMKISKQGDLYLGVGTLHDIEMAIEEGVVRPEDIRILAYLIPAIIVHEGNPKNTSSVEELAKPNIKISLANPDYGVGLFVMNMLKYNNI